MEVKRNKAEPVEVPPDTIDITGLTLREAGALQYLLMHGVTWSEQENDLHEFLYALYRALDVAPVRLKLDD